MSLIINTCGCYRERKKRVYRRNIKTVKIKGKEQKACCLRLSGKRHGEDLKREIPEIDALVGVGDDDRIVDYCTKNIAKSIVELLKNLRKHPMLT